MPGKIPWQVIGPAATIVVLILGIVFAFILKFQKQNKVTNTANTSALPKQSDTVSKKTLCYEHESKISSNSTKIDEMKEQQKIQRKENRDDHEKLFGKIDEMGTNIIQAIGKNKSQ